MNQIDNFKKNDWFQKKKSNRGHEIKSEDKLPTIRPD